jgi:hypothetical protein
MVAFVATNKRIRLKSALFIEHAVYDTFERDFNLVIELLFLQFHAISDPIKLNQNNAGQ